MKPHPRIRKTIKWGGAAVTVLLVVVWLGSGRWPVVCYTKSGYAIGIGQGWLTLGNATPYPPTNQIQFRPPWGYHLDVGFHRIRARIGWMVGGPIWPAALVSLMVAGIAWRLDTLARRRAKVNLCPKCNYDRTGILKDAKCPECGAASMQS